MNILMHEIDYPSNRTEMTAHWLLQNGCHPWFDWYIVKPALTNQFFLVQFQTDKVYDHLLVLNGLGQ